jgi:hypothetical protein
MLTRLLFRTWYRRRRAIRTPTGKRQQQRQRR